MHVKMCFLSKLNSRIYWKNVFFLCAFLSVRISINSYNSELLCTVMILAFRTDMHGQTVQTQVRLLLEEQSDQGLHCLQFPLHLLVALL